MKRYFQSVSNNSSPTKKPRRVFNPPIEGLIVSSEVKKEEAKQIVVDLPSAITHSTHLSTTTSVFTRPKLLNLSQQQTAKSCPVNTWVEYSGIIAKLSPSLISDKPIKGVIAFDVDGTIITTKSGKRFPVSDDDWKFWHPSVPDVLQRVSSEGYLLAFISNQGGIGNKKQSASGFQKKIDAIIDKVNVPIDFICSLGSDVYRKPCTGMWEFLSLASWEKAVAHSGGDAHAIECIYVGDAAGRPASGTRAKDFSDTDLKLALNLGVQFQTPERFFLQSNQSLHTATTLADDTSTPSRLCDWAKESGGRSWDEVVASVLSSGEVKEVVLLVAPPASGKSTLARALELHGYTRINQDELGSLKKCLDVAREHIQAGRKQLVVDNTNLSKDTRMQWQALARDADFSIRCVNLQLPKELCMLLSTFRLVHPNTLPQDKRKIETVVFHKFFKDLVFPSASEGYDRVDTIHWTPLSLDGQDEVVRLLYTMYLK